jgi:hypothetical protein
LIDRAKRSPDQGTGDEDIDSERFQDDDELTHDADPFSLAAMICGYG